VCVRERERGREQSFSGIKFTNQLEVVDIVNLYSSAKSENMFVFHSFCWEVQCIRTESEFRRRRGG
jgi:hypothetical protein